MTKSLAVQDTRIWDAIKIEDEESELVVRGWLHPSRRSEVDLSEHVANHRWFVRDRLTGMVQVVAPDEFANFWATTEEREFSKLADMLVGTVEQVLDWQYLDLTGGIDAEPVWWDALDEADARGKAKQLGSNLIRSRVTLVPDWVEQEA